MSASALAAPSARALAGAMFRPIIYGPPGGRVEARSDPEAGIWIATSDGVPGLTAERGDFATLTGMEADLLPLLLREKRRFGVGAARVAEHIAAHALSRPALRVAAQAANSRSDLIRLLQHAGCRFVRMAHGTHALWDSPSMARASSFSTICARASRPTLCRGRQRLRGRSDRSQ
ncbi:MAG: DUF1902 domain-containing protein [Sphingomonadaceae bacterium]|nr:DUF1902 domain-containing protein [Sphingomonadaceae bacterium]